MWLFCLETHFVLCKVPAIHFNEITTGYLAWSMTTYDFFSFIYRIYICWKENHFLLLKMQSQANLLTNNDYHCLVSFHTSIKYHIFTLTYAYISWGKVKTSIDLYFCFRIIINLCIYCCQVDIGCYSLWFIWVSKFSESCQHIMKKTHIPLMIVSLVVII